MSEIFVTAKQGVYPKGDTFRGILELQLEAAVLELMVFWGTEKREWVGVSRIFHVKFQTHFTQILGRAWGNRMAKVGQKLVKSRSKAG